MNEEQEKWITRINVYLEDMDCGVLRKIYFFVREAWKITSKKEYCNKHREVVEEKGDYLLTQDSIETLKKASLDILNGLNVDQEAITNIWQSITAEQERLSELEAEQQ